MLLFWALGCNGEGSSVVASLFLDVMLKTPSCNDSLIIYSTGSKLEEKIKPFVSLHSYHPRFIRLPSFARFYPVHFLIKLVFPVFLFFPKVIVFDDYPFRLARRQLLYFQQLNLLTSQTLLWSIKRCIFRILLSRNTFVYVQTDHVFEAFLTCFKHPKGKLFSFLHTI